MFRDEKILQTLKAKYEKLFAEHQELKAELEELKRIVRDYEGDSHG